MTKGKFELAALPPGLHWYRIVLGFMLLLFSVHLSAQDSPYSGIQRATGQDVSPMFNGWARNPDDSFSMYFGYLNRNSREEIDVPVGPDNFFDFGDGDQGQPSHFLAGNGNRARQMWVFNVRVPKDWPKDKRLVWTLKNRGRTNQAKGWLQPEWEVAKEGMRFGDYRNEVQQGDEIGEYKPPISVTVGPVQTVTLPATAAVRATAITGTSETRPVRIQWIHYRGPGRVTFDPPATSAKTNPVTSETKVSFSMPGVYRIRALATDGQWFSTSDVDVNVDPAR
jgi:hypothetical protein